MIRSRGPQIAEHGGAAVGARAARVFTVRCFARRRCAARLIASGAFAIGVAALGVLAPLAGARLSAQQSPPAAPPAHTPADTKFMQGMIIHHAQAIAMVALVESRTARTDLRMLAQRINVSQVDEIHWMQAWLKDRRESVPDSAMHAGMGHSPELMPGMLTPEELATLEASTGVEFERQFLAGMIRHHEGALVMVAGLLATPGAAQEPMIFGFAGDVDADQRAEIARMRKLLARLAPR